MPALDQLPAAIHATLTGFDEDALDAAAIRRLRELGFDEGVSIELVHRLPLGGPIVVRVGSMDVALRPSEARHVRVRTCQVEG